MNLHFACQEKQLRYPVALGLHLNSRSPALCASERSLVREPALRREHGRIWPAGAARQLPQFFTLGAIPCGPQVDRGHRTNKLPHFRHRQLAFPRITSERR